MMFSIASMPFQSTRPGWGEAANDHKNRLQKLFILYISWLRVFDKRDFGKNKGCTDGRNWVNWVRTQQGFTVNRRFASKDQWFIYRKGGRDSIVFDLAAIVVAEQIEADAIALFIHFREDQVPELGELRGIYLTFKHRVLHANAVVEAMLGNTPKPPLPFEVFYANIVCDQDEHIYPCLYFHINGG